MLRALGWLFGLLGLFCLLVFGLANAFLAELPTWAKVVGGVGVAGVAGWLASDWKALAAAGRDQTAARSGTALFAVVLALGITVTANVVAHRYDDRMDLTATKRFTLSPQSIDLVKALDREVKVIAFFTHGSPEQSSFEELMKSYRPHSTLLKTEFHDPYENPLLAEQMKIMSAAGTVILEAGDKQQRLESAFDEEAFTNALVRVTSDKEHPVCFTTGHEELDPDDESTASGLGAAKVKLEGQNYTVKKVSLIDGTPSPESCAVLVVASPRIDLLPAERDRVAQYVAGGGSAVFLLDPLMADATAADLARYGIAVGNDVVVESDPNRQIAGGDPTFVVLDAQSYDIHPLTQKLQGISVLRLARSVARGPEITGITVQELARTSPESWAETDLAETSVAAQPDEGQDRIGNVPVIVAAEVTDPAAVVTDTATAAGAAAPSPALPVLTARTPAAPPPEPKAGGKVVVFGDADFAGNQMLVGGVNQDLFLNTVAWMVGEEDQISIRANEAGKGKLTLDLVTLFLSGTIALVVVPGLTVVGAVGTWLVRRKL